MVRKLSTNGLIRLALTLCCLTALWAGWLALSGHPWSIALLAASVGSLGYSGVGWPGRERHRRAASPDPDGEPGGERCAELACPREL